MIFSNNPEKLSLFGGGCNENDRILDLYGGLFPVHARRARSTRAVGLASKIAALCAQREKECS